ncbi:hypothetical protein F4560_008559 [Saccharothrix ecbatanensis]|uniref:Uncharacterized protein n=1 Tax=Saccharothrix ecbatanensis TaxID=1105145 RepID=A0A7W9HVD7_9PSEU|nr:hypothetical protein [Saccharothrix ecbatanensis]MBB5808791.1 hypothetical protein [Saccharothrix ecbatanensis]
MAVDRGLWWSVWWPWAVVWIVTVLALVVAIGVAVVTWRAARRSDARPTLGVPVYLDGKAVLHIVATGRFGIERLPAEIISRAVLTKDGKISIPWLGNSGADVATTREEIKSYQKTYEPIDLIGELMEGLEHRNDLLHVDLDERTLLRNTALEQAESGPPARSLKLRRIQRFVSMQGVFRVVQQQNGMTVLLAPVGDPDDPEEGPQVRVECSDDWLLRDSVPEGTFNARCVGKVQRWKADTEELVVLPIAMFQ